VVQHVPAASNVQIRNLRDDHAYRIPMKPYRIFKAVADLV
jgi:hypothetical protein